MKTQNFNIFNMTTKTLLPVLLFSGIISCSAQKTEERSITPFNKLKLSGSVNVIYTTSDTLSLKLSGSEKGLATVDTKTENGLLTIENKNGSNGAITVYLRNNRLNYLEATGAVEFKNNGTLKTDSLQVSVTGAAKVTLNGEMDAVNCNLSGAANAVMRGRAQSISLTTSGASAFKGYGLTAGRADVVSTGASSAKLFVTDKVTASASGASAIKIKGEPRELNAEATTAASITRVNTPTGNPEKGDSDTTTYTFKNKKVIVISTDDNTEVKKERIGPDPDAFKHWTGFSMGINGFFNANGGTNMLKPYGYMELNYPRSFNYQFNLIERHFNLVKNNVKLVTGFGFDYHSYALANKTILNADSSFTWGTIDSTNRYNYKKNKLRNTYIQVPLLVEFNTSNNPEKTFHVAFGVVGEFLISSRTKQEVLELGKTRREVTLERKDSYNMNPFAAKAHVNLGYKGFTVFGEYNLTPLFQSGKGPELYPFTLGIRLVPFA